MQLKRYSTEELQDLCQDIFYQYMSAVNNDSYDYPTPAHLTHKGYEDKLKQYMDRMRLYHAKLQQVLPNDARNSLEKQFRCLQEGAEYLSKSNRLYQEELYRATHSTNYARTTVRIPLDKKINSYYDDFTLEVVFYDDVCTLDGKFDEYKKLHTEKDRREFIEQNTEITHMGLLFTKDEKVVSVIALKGELNTEDPIAKEKGIIMLPQKFSDFNRLTLKDTSSIQNNDLKQFIQSKIDLDKENMEELASAIVRGDRYSIHKAVNEKDNSFDLYIRYTCRGTGRVYYNMLNLRNLSISPLYEENNVDSYLEAWWDLNTLGGNPENEKPVIRC